MSGPWPHPDSGIFYFRKDTPSDLKRAKVRLQQLRVDYKNSFHRSLETKDRRLAELRYVKVKEDVESIWAQWRLLLEGKTVTLSHKDLHALAGIDAYEFLKRKEDDPQELARWDAILQREVDNYLALCGKGPSLARQSMFELGQRIIALPRYDLMPVLEEIRDSGKLSPLEREMVEVLLEIDDSIVSAWGDARARLITSQRGLLLDKPTVAKLSKICTMRLRDVMLTLRDRMRGDYSEPEWARKIPPYSGPKDSPSGAAVPVLTFEQVIQREERRGTDKKDLMAKNRATSEATIKKYRRIAATFSAWRNSTDITTINVTEVNEWMKALFATGKLKRTTVRLHAQALQALCGWAQEQGAREGRIVFPNGLPLAGLPLPEREETDSAARTFTIAQAQTILKATRKETDKERRWLPWLLAYTGMRIGDGSALTKADFMSIGGQYFIRVPFEKTKRPRWVPLHSDVVREGFIDYLKAREGGPLFSPRAQANLWEWINNEVFKGVANVPPANHGWRHFMESLIKRFDVSIRAGLYLTGRALDEETEKLLKSSAMGYGNDDIALMFYAAEVEKIPPILDLPQETERVKFQTLDAKPQGASESAQR